VNNFDHKKNCELSNFDQPPRPSIRQVEWGSGAGGYAPCCAMRFTPFLTYPAVENAIRLGEVEATDEREAIEKAAEKFQQNPAMLIVMRRP
jgi:hypothetical protein